MKEASVRASLRTEFYHKGHKITRGDANSRAEERSPYDPQEDRI